MTLQNLFGLRWGEIGGVCPGGTQLNKKVTPGLMTEKLLFSIHVNLIQSSGDLIRKIVEVHEAGKLYKIEETAMLYVSNFQKITWMFSTRHLRQCSAGRWDKRWHFWQKCTSLYEKGTANQHFIPSLKHGGGSRLVSWTAYSHWQKKEFQIASTYFTGEYQSSGPLPEIGCPDLNPIEMLWGRTVQNS